MHALTNSLTQRCARWLLFLLPALVLLLLPWGVLLPVGMAKYAIGIGGGFLLLAFAIVAWLQQRHIVLPRWWPVWTLLAPPIAYLIATIFSPHPLNSFFGEGFAADAFLPIALAAAAGVLAALLLRSRSDFFFFFATLFLSYWIGWIYTLFVALLPQIAASWGVALAPTPVGSWVQFAMWSGLMAVLSLVALVGFTFHEPRIRFALGGTLALALLALGVANVSYLWWLVGGVALATFVYSITTSRYIRPASSSTHHPPEGEEQAPAQESSLSEMSAGFRPTSLSLASLLTLAVSLVFLLSGTLLSTPLASFFGAVAVDVRPSWQATADILQKVYDASPFFGAGPSLFWREWVANRSVGVNATPFWNTEFLYATGFLPTAFITTGIVGAVAWIVLIIVFLWSGFRALVLRPTVDPLWYLFTLASFVGGAYLTTLAIVSTPPYPLIILLFFFVGAFYASLRQQVAGYGELSFSFVENPRLGFVVVLGLTVLFLASVVGLFVIGQRVVAWWHIGLAQRAENPDAVLAHLQRASQLMRDDSVFRFAVAAQLAKMNEVLNNQQLSEEERRSRFQELMTLTLQNAQQAIALDPQDYRNYVTLAQVYETLTALKVPEAYDRAKEAYEKARELNPTSPELLLGLARLEAARQEYEEAERYIEEALKLKGDYTPAIFLLAQLQIQQGKTDEAIRSVETTTILEPNNPVNFFQLGLLYYNEKEYEKAAEAFRRAVALNNRYANALFFLGLSEYKLGEKKKALERFQRLAQLDPTNELVQRALKNLKEGRAPLAQEGGSNGKETPSVEDLSEPPVAEPAQ